MECMRTIVKQQQTIGEHQLHANWANMSLMKNIVQNQEKMIEAHSKVLGLLGENNKNQEKMIAAQGKVLGLLGKIPNLMRESKKSTDDITAEIIKGNESLYKQGTQLFEQVSEQECKIKHVGAF